jgi:glycosyltransferase involved in cell wall biosynthesis
MARLLRQDRTALTHFFCAPNPRTCQAARMALRLHPRATLQTVCSIPLSFEQPDQLLFADRVVVLSRHTRDQFIAHGVPAGRLELIPPGIRLPAFPSPERRLAARRAMGLPEDRPVIIFPGDLQFSGAARTVARAVPLLRDLSPVVIFACRPKQEASLLEERRLRSELAHSGVASLVRHMGEVPDMLELLRACDLCLLPAESLYAKMDYPLVLLEALALGLPIVVADTPPLSELLDEPVGRAVPPNEPEALARACRDLLGGSLETRTAQATRCREVACQRHDIAAVSRKHEDLYQDLLRS